VDRITDDIAIHLVEAGLERGDRIALHFANSAEFAFSYLGCFKAGCIAVPVNPRLKYAEIDTILRHSGAACYIGQADLFAEAAKSRTRVPGIERYFLAGSLPDIPQARPFDSLLRPAGREGALPEIGFEQLAAIVYTSGTTSQPKGVAHSHGTLAQTAQMMRHALLDENQVVVVMSSMAHLIGFGMLLLSALLNGAAVAIAPALDPATILGTFERWRGTYTAGLPAAVHGMVQAQLASPRDVSSGRHYFCGGDSASPALQAEFRSVMGRPLFEMYGMTEITPIAWNGPDGVRIGSIGQPGEGIRIRLLNAEERDVQTGDTGEICVQGPHLTAGYWQDPEGGVPSPESSWFHTGDLARCDEDGYYWFAGRKKEVIIRGGSNISPQEVEAAICEHPAVSEAAVIGRRDPVWGETVAACVVLRPGETATEADLIAFTRERLADYKTPERVLFLSELPKSPVGKIQRRLLREREASRDLPVA
jgi:acyl-CoA synthetase (AMP-forming)/AMP-acid ligase II